MFTRDIEVEGFGILNIHYIHQRSELESAIPLLFVHGCTWNNGHLVSESLTLCVMRTVNRARQLHRGDKSVAALDCN
jgi:hypothetical protein